VTRVRTHPLLRSTTSSEGRGAKRTRAILVAVELALAVVLTIGAALMLQTLARLHAVDPGFRSDGLLTLHVQPTGARYRGMVVADYYERLLERVRGVAGVTDAGAIQHLPFSGYSWTTPVEVEGQPAPAAGERLPTVEVRVVTPGYFAAIGQPRVAGRVIERADAARPDVVVVNVAMAVKFFGSAEAALGRHLRTRGGMGPGPQSTIVGVVGNVRHNALTMEAGPEIYSSVGRNTIPAMMLAIRTGGDPSAVTAAVREAIRSVDRDVPLSAIQTMDAKIAASLGQPRLLLTLLTAFATLGLLLAVIGVYGVVAYSVAQRWRELGIMTALGAQRGRIVRSVLHEALAYGAAGLTLGLPAAFLASRLMKSVVWGVSATDPMTYASIALSTLAVVTVASLLPALRAARVDPVAALKAGL
jgi:putative ABC transport system permease protein